jgi:uncharacterized protein YxjI
MSVSAADHAQVLAAIEAADRLLVQQVFRPVANEYRISIAAPGSKEGRPLLFVKQKRLKVREDIRFRLDPDSDDHLFMIKSKTVFEFRGRHEVLDDQGQPIGLLEKDFAKSLLRSHWHVRDVAGVELFEAREASWPIALIRRVADWFPDWVAFLQWLPFNFTLVRDGEPVGDYRRILGTLRDRYVLELSPGLQGVDRRLLLAFAIALDALQDR